MKKDLLYLLTFISILIIVFSTGYFSTNYLVDISSQQFLKNQLASSKREAKEMANFIADRVEQGIPKQQIIYTIQNMIEGTDMEAGFICMFDWSGKEICHPDPREIGKLVVQNQTYVNGIGDNVDEGDFYEYLTKKKEGGGVRHFLQEDKDSEIIYIYPVAKTDWIIAAHANLTQMQKDIAELKNSFHLVYGLTGAVIVILCILIVRVLGSYYESRLEQENESLSEELANLLKMNKDLDTAKNKVVGEIASVEETENGNAKSRILTYSRNELVPIETKQIAYIYTEQSITYIYCIDGKRSISNSSLEELFKSLDSHLFFRANRQFILSINAIHKILRYGNNQLKIEIHPASDVEIIISKNKVAEFKQWLNR